MCGVLLLDGNIYDYVTLFSVLCPILQDLIWITPKLYARCDVCIVINVDQVSSSLTHQREHFKGHRGYLSFRQELAISGDVALE